MLLTVKKRQEYLKTLGFYEGKIDGKEGPLTTKAYYKLQSEYFKRSKDIDKKYGKNTDILLRNVYNIYKYCKNFNIREFECKCGGKYCTGYPAILDTNLLKNVQLVRNKFGVLSITSGLRCKVWNSKQTGSSKSSRHMSGKAVDVSNQSTKLITGRKEMINYWFTLNKPNYGYCNGFYRSGKKTGTIKATNMGSAVHMDVK